MGDHIARAEEFEKKAEKKLSSWGFFGSKHEDAAELFDKSANSYKLGKSCEFSPFYFLYFLAIGYFLCHFPYWSVCLPRKCNWNDNHS